MLESLWILLALFFCSLGTEAERSFSSAIQRHSMRALNPTYPL